MAHEVGPLARVSNLSESLREHDTVVGHQSAKNSLNLRLVLACDARHEQRNQAEAVQRALKLADMFHLLNEAARCCCISLPRGVADRAMPSD